MQRQSYERGKLMKFEGLKVSLFLPPLGVLRGPEECDVHHRAEDGKHIQVLGFDIESF